MSTVFELYAVYGNCSHIEIDRFLDFGVDYVPDFPSYVRNQLQNLFEYDSNCHKPLLIDDQLIANIREQTVDYDVSFEWWNELYSGWTIKKRKSMEKQGHTMFYDSKFLEHFVEFLTKNKDLYLVYRVI